MGDMYRRLEEGRLRAAVRAVENIPRHETMTASRSAQVKKSIIDIEIELQELIFCMNLSKQERGSSSFQKEVPEASATTSAAAANTTINNADRIRGRDRGSGCNLS